MRRAEILLANALRLWRGKALAGVEPSRKLSSVAARLEEARAHVFEDLVEARLVLGKHGDVISQLKGEVLLNPLRERLWAQLMLALYRNGRQADALSAF